MKRFTDTEKWTKNKWFRKLSKDMKLFWLFILDNCDCVGVWEEDVEFVNEFLELSLIKEEILTSLGKQILVMPGDRKWWIKDFCNFQYGTLKADNIKNKPHVRYITELKKHRLWIDYTKTMHSLEEKEEEKEKEEDILSKMEKILTDEEKESFKKFEDWIAKNAINVSKMKEVFTGEQFLKIKNKYSMSVITEVLKSMHNKKTLLKDYNSAYLTFTNWANRRLNDAA